MSQPASIYPVYEAARQRMLEAITSAYAAAQELELGRLGSALVELDKVTILTAEARKLALNPPPAVVVDKKQCELGLGAEGCEACQ